MPVPTSFAPSRVVQFDAALLVEREFAAYLLPGQIIGPPGYLSLIVGHPELVRQELFTGFTVTLDDALTQGRIWLIAFGRRKIGRIEDAIRRIGNGGHGVQKLSLIVQ